MQLDTSARALFGPLILCCIRILLHISVMYLSKKKLQILILNLIWEIFCQGQFLLRPVVEVTGGEINCLPIYFTNNSTHVLTSPTYSNIFDLISI